MPTTGVMPMHMPMLTKVWNASAAATPKQMSMPNGLPERRPMTQQRMMIMLKSTIIAMQATMPSSSPIEAKMQSVCRAL